MKKLKEEEAAAATKNLIASAATTTTMTTATSASTTTPATTTATTTTATTSQAQVETTSSTTTSTTTTSTSSLPKRLREPASTSSLPKANEVTKSNWDGKTKSSDFPLGECEGECDKDRDCKGDLICYQRNSGHSIPGCSGVPNSGSDFCIDPKAKKDAIPYDFDNQDREGTTYSGRSNPTRLRLYWHEFYYWQEIRDETFFCMQCTGDCKDGTKIKINTCDEDNERQLFVTDGETIRPAGDNSLCFTETGFKGEEEPVELKPCNDATKQNFWGFKEEGPFQLRPRTNMTMCLTQMHHPKIHELVFPRNCTKAEENDTSLWTTY